MWKFIVGILLCCWGFCDGNQLNQRFCQYQTFPQVNFNCFGSNTPEPVSLSPQSGPCCNQPCKCSSGCFCDAAGTCFCPEKPAGQTGDSVEATNTPNSEISPTPIASETDCQSYKDHIESLKTQNTILIIVLVLIVILLLLMIFMMKKKDIKRFRNSFRSRSSSFVACTGVTPYSQTVRRIELEDEYADPLDIPVYAEVDKIKKEISRIEESPETTIVAENIIEPSTDNISPSN